MSEKGLIIHTYIDKNSLHMRKKQNKCAWQAGNFSQAFNMCVWQLGTEQNQQIPFSKYDTYNQVSADGSRAL